MPLAKLLGSEVARRSWRLSGAPPLALATSSQVTRVYRELGLAVARARARALLRTLPHALGPVVEPAGSSAHQAPVRARRRTDRERAYELAGRPVVSIRPLVLV